MGKYLHIMAKGWPEYTVSGVGLVTRSVPILISRKANHKIECSIEDDILAPVVTQGWFPWSCCGYSGYTPGPSFNRVYVAGLVPFSILRKHYPNWAMQSIFAQYSTWNTVQARLGNLTVTPGDFTWWVNQSGDTSSLLLNGPLGSVTTPEGYRDYYYSYDDMEEILKKMIDNYGYDFWYPRLVTKCGKAIADDLRGNMCILASKFSFENPGGTPRNLGGNIGYNAAFYLEFGAAYMGSYSVLPADVNGNQVIAHGLFYTDNKTIPQSWFVRNAANRFYSNQGTPYCIGENYQMSFDNSPWISPTKGTICEKSAVVGTDQFFTVLETSAGNSVYIRRDYSRIDPDSGLFIPQQVLTNLNFKSDIEVQKAIDVRSPVQLNQLEEKIKSIRSGYVRKIKP